MHFWKITCYLQNFSLQGFSLHRVSTKDDTYHFVSIEFHHLPLQRALKNKVNMDLIWCKALYHMLINFKNNSTVILPIEFAEPKDIMPFHFSTRLEDDCTWNWTCIAKLLWNRKSSSQDFTICNCNHQSSSQELSGSKNVGSVMAEEVQPPINAWMSINAIEF